MNTPSKWSDRTRIYPISMANLVILVTRVYLPIPLRFGWVSIQITPPELVLLESCAAEGIIQDTLPKWSD